MVRVINLLGLALLGLLALGLYKAKTEAHAARERAEALEVAVAEAREDIVMLRAEVGHLNEPPRLQALAEEHLGLRQVDYFRVVRLSEAPLFLRSPVAEIEIGPGDDELLARFAVSGTY